MILEHRQAVVVGSGLAGATVALSLSPLDTLVISKTAGPVSGSTPWAQGGVAFPRDEADKPLHIQDTLVSGAGLGEASAVGFLIDRAPAARAWLESQGVLFDRDTDGQYLYGREGAHSSRRILHVGGDGTGAELARHFSARLQQTPHVTFRPRTMALRLVPGGLLTFQADRGLVLILSPRIFLAGGGLGQLFDATTAPVEGTGDTIALALEAGASVTDLEMVQFHPTALGTRGPASASLSLLTEALRGEGAVLVTSDGSKQIVPLDTGHPLGSLGPRDVLSRAIWSRQAAGHPVWLDARGVSDLKRKFPTVTRLCADVGLDPTADLLPVVPAAHYTMGGIVTDLNGRTSLAGVWAAGENARTGIHGGNRLASNSLLECVVFGRAAAADTQEALPPATLSEEAARAVVTGLAAWKLPHPSKSAWIKGQVVASVSRAAGPVRWGPQLEAGLDTLASLRGEWDKAASGGRPLADLTFDETRTILEARNLLLLGHEVLTQALARKTSLGAHFRGDEDRG